MDEPEGNQLLDAPHNLGSSLLVWVQTFQGIYLQKFITAVELILGLLKHKYKTLNKCKSFSQERFFEKNNMKLVTLIAVKCKSHFVREQEVRWDKPTAESMTWNETWDETVRQMRQCVSGVLQRIFPKLDLLLSSGEKSEASTLLCLLERAKRKNWTT